jgi:hypothetical protein
MGTWNYNKNEIKLILASMKIMLWCFTWLTQIFHGNIIIWYLLLKQKFICFHSRFKYKFTFKLCLMLIIQQNSKILKLINGSHDFFLKTPLVWLPNQHI